MKYKIFTPLIILLFSLTIFSCSTIEYLGETYTPSPSIEIFYDTKLVKKPYKIIGRMSELTLWVDKVKDEMIKKAKTVGGDGVIFTDLTEDSNGVIIKAEVFRYL